MWIVRHRGVVLRRRLHLRRRGLRRLLQREPHVRALLRRVVLVVWRRGHDVQGLRGGARLQHGRKLRVRRDVVSQRVLHGGRRVPAVELGVDLVVWNGGRCVLAVRDGPSVQREHRNLRLRLSVVPERVLQWQYVRALRLGVGVRVRRRRRHVRGLR